MTTQSVMPVIYLAQQSPTGSIYLPSELAEQASSPGLHDISAHEVYLATDVTVSTVSSYPWSVSATKLPIKVVTFSPLPRQSMAVYFCGTCCSRLSETFPLGSMMLCAARTFLPRKSDKPVCFYLLSLSTFENDRRCKDMALTRNGKAFRIYSMISLVDEIPSVVEV